MKTNGYEIYENTYGGNDEFSYSFFSLMCKIMTLLIPFSILIISNPTFSVL